MPGPKMGPRPTDFNEALVKQSPTFVKWSKLSPGEKLRYACRDFIKGQENDEERLMRRIMIARRNNLRDHEILLKARKQDGGLPETESTTKAPSPSTAAASAEEKENPTVIDENNTTKAASTCKRRPASTFTDAQVAKEMDVPAVEATRSYKAWMALEDGQEFTYNQKYVKGKEGHDWLLRKNIWRRMRYRRENKKIVAHLLEEDPSIGLIRKKREQQMHRQQNLNKNAGKTTVKASDIKKEAAASRARPHNTENESDSAVVGQAGMGVAGTKRAQDPTNEESNKMPKLEDTTPPPLEDAMLSNNHSGMPDIPPPPSDNNVMDMSSHDDDHNDAALTAAAAATASGADDLVELSAVEAAVAAAASYVQLTTQNNEEDDHDEDEINDDIDAAPGNAVHNPLEAAANAAALDSAAKLAAAASQMNQDEDEDEDDEEQVQVVAT